MTPRAPKPPPGLSEAERKRWLAYHGPHDKLCGCETCMAPRMETLGWGGASPSGKQSAATQSANLLAELKEQTQVLKDIVAQLRRLNQEVSK